MTDTDLKQLPGLTRTGTEDDRLLHIVLKSHYPVALCGFVVLEEWQPGRRDSRDRCFDCLKIAKQRDYRWDGSGNPL